MLCIYIATCGLKLFNNTGEKDHIPVDLGHELVQGPYRQIAYLVKAQGQEERTLACGWVWIVVFFYLIYYLYLIL